jgi:Tol biopolymer transport system component
VTPKALTAVVLVAAMSVAGCGGGSSNEGRPASVGSPVTAPATAATGAATATPSGDGELIVFERLVPGQEDRDLYTVAPDGGEPRLLRSPGGYPHWSADGNTLAFNGCLDPPGCTNGVALLERTTGEVHGFPMPDPGLFTACAIWAPSGRTLACEGNSDGLGRNGVYTVRASDGNGLTRITRSPGDDLPLTYSPDGRRLLLDRGTGEGSEHHALFVTRADGSDPHRITPWGYSDDSASWSPDGATIVFGTSGSLYRVSPDGKGFAKLSVQTPDGLPVTYVFDVAFSPDGQRIVFSVAGAEPGLYLAARDGSDAERLTTSPAEDHHANWGAWSGS